MEKTPRTEYVIFECPHCGGKMCFKKEPAPRKEKCVCAKCGKQLEVSIKP